MGRQHGRAFDNPEACLTGTITVDGREPAIVPEKCVGWVDLQWGNSYAADGWFSFMIRLDNGVRIVTMTTNPSPKYTQCSISTLMFPNSHYEVHTVDTDVHPSDPWVDPYTNITYFNICLNSIQSRNILLYWTLAMKGDNTTIRSDPSQLNSVTDSYSTLDGFFDGLLVTGYGISEKRETSTLA